MLTATSTSVPTSPGRGDSEEEDAIVYKTPFVLDRSALEYELAIDGQDEGQDHNISSPSNPKSLFHHPLLPSLKKPQDWVPQSLKRWSPSSSIHLQRHIFVITTFSHAILAI
ncbi:hypothetical protein H4Q26_014755 [Puccinia striiformis f. sp. tritici PST-130]|nr:hypothetical protein H4Q26_014755 [Puccinia striiformis f. sp. tritici PST-130]